MPLKVFNRARWGAKQPWKTTAQGNPTEAFLHHSADTDAGSLDTFAEQAAHMRQVQDFHMAKPWSDIGYHYVVFQPYGKLTRARVFAGRDPSTVPAAQLGHNTGTLAICVVGNFERDGVKRNTRYVIEQLVRSHPSVKVLGGHRDVTPTTCPGDHLYSEIPRIARAAGVRVYGT